MITRNLSTFYSIVQKFYEKIRQNYQRYIGTYE